MLENLITDRTAADVWHWLQLRDKGRVYMTEEELAEWNAGTMKGAYNVSDLNRVGIALNYVRDRLIEAGYLEWGAFAARINWASSDVPTVDDLTKYLSYVSIVREALSQFTTTPPTPTNTGALDYAEANAIEQIIIDVDKLISNMLAARHFCGELYAGEA